MIMLFLLILICIKNYLGCGDTLERSSRPFLALVSEILFDSINYLFKRIRGDNIILCHIVSTNLSLTSVSLTSLKSP